MVMRLDDSHGGGVVRAPVTPYVPLPAARPAPVRQAPAKKATTAAKKAPVKKATTAVKRGSGGGGGGGSSTPNKAADGAQVSALEALLNSGFKSALDQRLANIRQAREQGDSVLMKGYDLRLGGLLDAREDNEMAEATASFANLTNRAREAGDILVQAASQGAGETDQLATQLISARNWLANQTEVNRSYYDSLTSNNSAITDLNLDTRSARYNLANQSMSDEEQAWATYSNQIQDAATQLGNIYGNPYSDSYKKDGGKAAFTKMQTTASEAWKNPGVSAEILDWRGTAQAKQEQLNNHMLASDWDGLDTQGKPEGSTVKGRRKSTKLAEW